MLFKKITRYSLWFLSLLIMIAVLVPDMVAASMLRPDGERPPVFIEFAARHFEGLSVEDKDQVFETMKENSQDGGDNFLVARRNLEFQYLAANDLEITINDQDGNLVGRRRLEANRRPEFSKIPVNRWKSGVYAIRIASEGYVETYKLVVE